MRKSASLLLALAGVLGAAAADVTVTASHCYLSDTVDALFDGKVPISSYDVAIPRFTFWDRTNAAARTGDQWVECVFAQPRTLRRIEVYWFDDKFRNRGDCTLPVQWRVLTRAKADATTWTPAPEGTTYTTVRDTFSCAMLPAAVTVQAIRIELTCVTNCSAGILEVRTSEKGPAARPDPAARRTARDSLAPAALTPLPLGTIRPAGWLKYQLDLMTDGLVGHLYEKSSYLRPDNGWLNPAGAGWEEQPYWLRSFIKLAVLTQNERCLRVSKEWVEKILATREPDGWFGPKNLKDHDFGNGVVLSDIWGHMVMCEALWSWWEYSHDERVFNLLADFMRYLARTNPDHLIAPKVHPARGWRWQWNIQHERAGDLLPAVFNVYASTRDPALLDLADRLRNKLLPPGRVWMHIHNVTFSQRFAYETIYSRLSRDPSDRGAADYWYDLHMAEWGQMPRGAFASDECCRYGATDPRYATETCTWAELTRSFQLLSDVTGDAKWADRNEDIVFNHAPAAYTPDWKALHYLTACNQVMADGRTDHNHFNGPPMVAFSSEAYRCCRHNAALTFPLFTENLVKKAVDGALVFWMYAPHTGETVLDGNKVAWSLETCYPFRETARLTVTAARPTRLRFRVPAWARAFSAGTVQANGARFVETTVPAGRSQLDLAMQAVCEYHVWPRTGGVTVDRGPLSYSLAIGEKYGQIRTAQNGGSPVWTEKPVHTPGLFTEVLPTTEKWNYALDTSKELAYQTCAWTNDCFVSTHAPCEIWAMGRRLPEWTLQDNEPAELQRSPAYTAEPLERLRFVPLGCQRLRLSVLPRGTDDPVAGHVWQETPAYTLRRNRVR